MPRSFLDPDGDLCSDGYCYGYSNADGDADTDVYADRHYYCDLYAYSYGDFYADGYCYSYSNADGDTNTDTYCNGDSYSNDNSQPDAYSYANVQRRGDAGAVDDRG